MADGARDGDHVNGGHRHDDDDGHDRDPVDREQALDDLVARLRAGGERVTTARRLVLQALLDAGQHHLSAEQLAASIQRTNPDVNLSTVYRTLEVLEATGLVIRAGLGGAATTYHLVDHPHHHAVCDRCGAVIVLPAAAFDAVVRRLDREHGFSARPSHLSVSGLCADCRP